MNNLKNKIFALLLIPVILFSTTSFRIEKHQCAGRIVSFSLIGSAESCEMEMEECAMENKTCEISDDDPFQNYSFSHTNDCCENIDQFVQGSTIVLDNNKPLNKLQIIFLTAYTYTLAALIPSTENRLAKYLNYSPPLIDRDISVLFQVFII